MPIRLVEVFDKILRNGVMMIVCWKRSVRSVVVAVLILCSGCRFQQPQPNSQVAPVQGVVTLNGKPLPRADITFESVSSRPSGAITDANGRYELQYDQWTKGAYIGSHTVRIDRYFEPMKEKRPKSLPERYNRQSELTVIVQPGENVFDFHLTEVEEEPETPVSVDSESSPVP